MSQVFQSFLSVGAGPARAVIYIWAGGGVHTILGGPLTQQYLRGESFLPKYQSCLQVRFMLKRTSGRVIFVISFHFFLENI